MRSTPKALLFLLALSLTSYSPAVDDISLYGFSVNGKQHAAIVLRQGRDHGHMDELAAFMFARAEDWLIRYYQSRGLIQADDAMTEKLKTVEKIRDGRSSLIMISEWPDITKIYGMIRFSETTPEDQTLPLERRLLGRGLTDRLERPPVRFGFYPVSGLFNDIHDQQRNLWGLSGGILEIKNFALSPESLSDFGPAILYIAEQSGVSFVRRPRIVSPESTEGNIPPGYRLHEPHHVYASEYAIECDSTPQNQKLKKYYEHLGFTERFSFPNPDIPGNTTHVMGISREEFRNIGRKWESRKGVGLISSIQLNEMLWASHQRTILDPLDFSMRPPMDRRNSCARLLIQMLESRP